MFANQNSSLISEMELVKSLMKLTPEERKKEVRRRMYEELRAVEMERRERAMERLKMEREEREQLEEMVKRQREKSLEEREIQEARQREEEERKAHELKALQKAELEKVKQERLPWKEMMQVEEEPGRRPRYTTCALKEEQQERQEEAELYRPQRVRDRASRDRLTSDLKAPKHQERKKALINNWVGEQKSESEAVREMPVPVKCTSPCFSAKMAPQSKEKTDKQTPKPKEPKQWLPDRLKVQYWVGRYQDHKEKKDEKRKQKAEEQYARWAAIKASRAGHASRQNNSYAGGFSANRNSILKSIF
ncbi:vicilin-like seed storage protein At2g18540 [Notolabrus celidotus]|uniref:vicilin-like seed storage protein At2g18540 n=1 Tax=Notolabrus celidotus TaxID=1203425 RepID=UPI0014902AF4|nr:vicilin-like seed storage protein At2g18540 [Notolabrus celidotus]